MHGERAVRRLPVRRAALHGLPTAGRRGRPHPSPAPFLYYNERQKEHTLAEDAGALLSDGVESLCVNGICPESEWPYDVTRFRTPPPPQCYRDARLNRASVVQNLRNTLPSMCTCLSMNRPFVVGIRIYESFESPEVTRTGRVPMPRLGQERALGGHAVLVCGYDEGAREFIVRNSWGCGWGDGGYFYLPYEYLLDPELASDLWVIHAVRHS